MARQAILLEQCKTLQHRAVGRQLGGGQQRGKTLRLRHLTRDCHKLLNRAGQLIVDSDDDPDYGVAVDYSVRTGSFGGAH